MTIFTRTPVTGISTTGNPLTNAQLDNNFIESINEPFVPENVMSPLHRSPNAVNAMFVYDVSKDSDGGAWTDKCQHTSWYNESLSGKWLGAAATEAAARAVSGATTGDYFQLTTDGKFYKLNATSGTTEVFRGNKAKFPKLVGIVAEAASITLYDLTEFGRPMWMRFAYQSGAVGFLQSTATNGLYAQNAKLAITGGAGSGLLAVDFTKDNAIIYFVAATYTHRGNITQRNNTLGYQVTGASALPSNTTHAVAMTVLPDAPLDLVTGLQVPTIWVCTQGGLSVIQQNGIVVSNTNGAATGISVINPNTVQIVAASGSYYHGYARLLQGVLTIFGQSSSWIATALPKVSNQNNSTARLSSGQKQQVAIGFGFDPSNIAVVTRLNASNPLQNISTYISSLFNTGYMLGDIRRAYLADSLVGAIGPTAELVVNGTFDTDVSGWTISSGTAASVSGVLQLTNAASNVPGVIRQTINVVIGKTYRVTGQGGLGNNGKAAVQMGTALDGTDILNATWTLGLVVSTFVATTSTIYVKVVCQDAMTGYYGSADNISIKEVVKDRSYKSASTNIYGTLTKSLTNTANQVVAYSGFSTANYLQEPYSADLDFGTGEWSVSAWVDIPVVLPAANFPTTGSEIITDPEFDDATKWTISSGASITGSQCIFASVGSQQGASVIAPGSTTQGVLYKVTIVISSYTAGGVKGYIGGTFGKIFQAVGTFTDYIIAGANGLVQVLANGTTTAVIDICSVKAVLPALMCDRNYSSGASVKLGVNGNGTLQATVYDGTTTRTVTTTAAYNNASLLKASAVYKTDGSLAITINGVQVAVTTGLPLLTLNNTSAVLTIGNSYALDAPFPGSIALLKLSATAPTQEQDVFMYEQEKLLFRDNANCLLPDSTAITSLAYDDLTDEWISTSSTNESSWTGLIRNNVVPVPSGLYTNMAAGSGVKLNARSTTNIGVDISTPKYMQREQLLRLAESVVKVNKSPIIFDFDTIGFTANTTSGTSNLTNVTVTSGTPYVGMGISGTGIGTNATITYLGTNFYRVSINSTATSSAVVSVGQTTFTTNVGVSTNIVRSAGSIKRLGSAKDYTISFDGFKETVTFNTSPGSATWVQIESIRN